ncbi:hypothetical protein [Reinekea sp.]|jgi:hypothetical protein|uniref:hypothetical protein n=1 Tax=Reinekea sp. TaxID=1970455 RepID=UPI0039891274
MTLNKNRISVTVQVDAGYISVEEFAKRTGQTSESVKQQCKRGQLPVAPREKENSKYYVNNALLITQAIAREY